MNNHAIITAAASLLALGSSACAPLHTGAQWIDEQTRSPAQERWSVRQAEACQAAGDYLRACDEELVNIQVYCRDVDEGIEHCERYHGVGARQCAGFYVQLEDCERQRQDMFGQRRQASRAIWRYCGVAEDDNA